MTSDTGDVQAQTQAETQTQSQVDDRGDDRARGRARGDGGDRIAAGAVYPALVFSALSAVQVCS